jgi:AraC family transcriptional regulator of adaptative response / DNA-3-methyladenine glycosylase II
MLLPALDVDLPVRRPFAADALLGFLAAHTVPGVEHVVGRTSFRSLRLPGGPGTAALTLPADAGTDAVRARFRLSSADDLPVAVRHARNLLDLDAHAAAIDAALSSDPALSNAVEDQPGLRVPGTVDGPETLIRTILGQQVSVAGAQTAAARLVRAVDDRLPAPDGALTHLFPTPGAVAALGPEAIAGPRRRAQAVSAAAAAMADGSLRVDAGRTTAGLTADLVAQPGIGPWTAGYVAMRLLRDPDVLLVGDLVLRKGAALLGLPDAPRVLAARSERWHPYRSYAGMHLWRTALAQRGRLDSRP